MAVIPTIPGSAPVSSPEIGVKHDPRPTLRLLGQTADTFQAGARAVQQGMSAIADYENRKQQAEEVATFNKTSIVLNKTTEEYRHNLKTMPDQKIVPDWMELAGKTKTEILNNSKDLTPKARTKLEEHLDTWASNSTIEFQVASDHLASQRRKGIATAAADQFLQTGDEAFVPNAVAAIRSAQQAGDITPEEAEQRISVFPRVLQENQVRNGIDANPQATLKDIQDGHFKDIPPGPLLTLKREAQAAVSHLQSQGRDDMLQRIDTGETIDDSEITQREKAGEISAMGAKSIKARIRQDDMRKASDEHFIQMQETYDHDWAGDKEPEVTAQKMKDKAAALPPSLREPVNRLISNKLASAKSALAATQRPVESQVLSQMRDDRESQGMFFPSPALGEGETKYGHLTGGIKVLEKMTDEKVKDLYGTSKEKVIEAEKLHYAKTQDKMRAWFHDPANKNATIEQANDYRMELEKPFVHSAAKAALNAPVDDKELAKLLKKYGQ